MSTPTEYKNNSVIRISRRNCTITAQLNRSGSNLIALMRCYIYGLNHTLSTETFVKFG